MPTIRSYADLAEHVDSDGYVSKFNSAFYVYNLATPSTTYNAEGQSNDTVSVRWKNTGHSVYVIKLDKRIQAQHENFSHKNAGRSYIIVAASGQDLSDAIFSFNGEPQRKVAELLTQGVIYKTMTFDPSEPDVTLSIPLEGNTRSYTSMLPAVVNTNGAAQYIRPAATRSVLETLGVQRR